ncbi:MAG: hypothetical protein M3401_02570 [Actinomycetota bacterium]|nr:hypothetical protein [Actinomycetota bacterium]
MADGEDGEREVLTSLPRSRPVRRSAKRGERSRTEAGEGKPAASRESAPSRRKAAAAGGGKSASNATRKAPAKAARPKAARKPRARATEEAQPRVPPQRKVPPAGYAAPSSADGDSPPGATELLTTAIQAATELAQIGISVGRQALRSAFERLPKP